MLYLITLFSEPAIGAGQVRMGEDDGANMTGMAAAGGGRRARQGRQGRQGNRGREETHGMHIYPRSRL